MHESQLRWMIGLSVLVLLLVGALSLGESDTGDPADPDASAVVLQIADIDAVVRIERQIQGEQLILVREGEQWRMESPDEADADGRTVQRLLDDLRELDKGIPLQTDGASPEDYGLGDPPLVAVRLTLADGAVHEARYGDPAPVGWRTYAYDRDGQIVAVGGRSDLLTEPSSAFQDHRLLVFDPAQVRRVTLENPPHTLTVRGQGTTWWLDGFTRADPDRVDDLVMGLLDLRFDRVLQVRDVIAEPRARVEVELADGSVQEARVGERTPMGDLVQGPRAKGMVFPDSLALLGMGPTDIGDPHAIPLSLERDSRVEIERGGATWVATRDAKGTWRSADLDEAATWARLNALAHASIAYQREPVDGPQVPWATVRVEREGAARTVVFGPESEGFHPARDADGGSPYKVHASQIGAALGG